MSCSKGTYIRTLAEDIGQALGCGGHISQLRRLKTGPFTGDAMWTLGALEALADQTAREAELMPVDVLVDHLPAVSVDEAAFGRLAHGQSFHLPAQTLDPDAVTRLYHANAFIGLGVVKQQVPGAQEVAPKRLLSSVAIS